MSQNDYVSFLQVNDFHFFMMLVTGGLMAFMIRNYKDKDVSLPTIPIWYSVLLVCVLSLHRIINEPLWYDETFAVMTSSIDKFNDIMTVVLSDVHTPTHYLILNVWMKILGSSQVMVRFPSMIAGMLCVVASYELAKTYFDDNMASWSAVLVAVTPTAIHYSAEARYPVFLLLFVLLALLSIRRDWKYSYLLIAIPAWWHITAVPYSLALLWYGRASFNRKQVFKSLVLSLMMTPLALIQSQDVANGFWLKLRFPLHHMMMGFAVRQNELVLIVLPLVGALVVFSIFYQRRLHQKHFILIWGVPISLWIVSALIMPVYLHRTLIASVVLIVIFSTPLLFKRHTFIVILFLWFLSVGMYYSGQKELSIPDVLKQCEGQDYIVATSTGMTMMIMYHSDLPAYSYGIDTNSQWLSDDAKTALGFTAPPEQGRACTIVQSNTETEIMERLQVANSRLFTAFDYGQFTKLEVYHD